MNRCLSSSCPSSETELHDRCLAIEGLTFSQLSRLLGIVIPETQARRKGWAGMAIERALGASAGSKPQPDFVSLGIELKTIPLNAKGIPAESTFVTSIALLTHHQERWKSSQCYQKLKRILWIPIEGDRAIPFGHRRIGQGRLWSPSEETEAILQADWEELSLLICTGRVDEINASLGTYLQVRPKGANAKSLCYGYDAEGGKSLTLPRGFYLRALFTRQIINGER